MKQLARPKRPRRSGRRGAILVCVLVCLGIATAIMMVSVRTSLRVRRQMRQELQLEQTRWLLEAGTNRAVSEIRKEPAYRGETWRVEPALDAYPDSTVEIVVTTDAVPADKARLTITAQLRRTDSNSEPIRRSNTLVVGLTKTTSQ